MFWLVLLASSPDAQSTLWWCQKPPSQKACTLCILVWHPVYITLVTIRQKKVRFRKWPVTLGIRWEVNSGLLGDSRACYAGFFFFFDKVGMRTSCLKSTFAEFEGFLLLPFPSEGPAWCRGWAFHLTWVCLMWKATNILIFFIIFF